LTDDRKQYLYEYTKNNLHRIPLNVSNDMYNRIKQAADQKNMPVNTFIKWLLGKYLDFDQQA